MTQNAETALPTIDVLGRQDFIAAIRCEAKTNVETLSASEVQAQAEDTAGRHFERLSPVRDTLAADRLATPFLPVAVVKHCLGVAERVVSYVDEMLQLPGVRPERLLLRERTLAFWHADSRLTYATDNVPLERSLIDEGKPLRDAMLQDWGAPMVLWGVLTQQELSTLKNGKGHDDLANDLVFLGERCVQRWAKLDGRVLFTLEDARRALSVGNQLMVARAVPDVVPPADGEQSVTKAREDHRRAFTLVLESINEYRKGLAWLRRDDPGFDVDKVVPSPYTIRRAPVAKPAQKAEDAPTSAAV